MEREETIEAMELKQLRTQLSLDDDGLIELFNKIDRDRDGKISYKELKNELRSNGCIPPDFAKKIMRMGDVDENGYLSLEEFRTLLKENKEVKGLLSQCVNKWVNTVCYIPRRRVPFAEMTVDGRGQYEEEYSCCPPPLCMIIVSILEIIVYVYDAIVRKPSQPYIQADLAKLFIYNPHRRAEAWRFLTYMFVHIGIFHLIVNLFVQIILGIPLEMVHKWWRVLIIYITGVVAGSLGTSISDPRVLLAGASGGVYAIITAHVASLITNWKEMEFASVQLVIFIFLAASDIGSAVYNRYILNIEDQVSYVAHLAGATAGLLVGINVLRNLEVRPWEKKLCNRISVPSLFQQPMMDYKVSSEEEFKRNKELREEDLKALKDWYSLQAHLPPIKDELLIQLLHSCWYKMEPAKATTDNYFTVRTHSPELFTQRDPFTVNLRKGKPVVQYFFLGNKTPENHRVLWIKLLNTDPSVYVFSEASKAFVMQYDLELYINGTASGDVMVFDMEGLSLGHVARLNLSVAKKLFMYMQEAMPVRIINLHFVNVVPFVDKIMALLRPFMNKEFMDKLVFHTEGFESLYKLVPKKIMPKEYGGEDKTITELSDKQIKLMEGNKAWFDSTEGLLCDELKRPENSKLDASIFGIEGSFKKLDFD